MHDDLYRKIIETVVSFILYCIPLTQIAFAYGYGAIKWGYDPYNAIYVPNALFSYTEDESQ